MPAIYFPVLVSGQQNSPLNFPETYGRRTWFIVFDKATFSPKLCRGHVRTSGAVMCPELFPLATRSMKTHVSSQRSSTVSEASPREPYFYFGASLFSCPSKGQEKILDPLALQETPCLISISLNHTLFGSLSSAMMWLLIHFAFQEVIFDTSHWALSS